MIWKRIAKPVVAFAMLIGFTSGAAAQDPTTVNAFAFWQGQGQVVETGEQRFAIIGAFGGPLFVETTEGPVETGVITCPVLLQIDARSGRQSGTGACTFVADDGARAFGSFECAGVHLVGCRGTFTLTGGTDRLAGASGSGTMLFRGRPERLRPAAGSLAADSIGIAVWRDLKVTIAAPSPTRP